MVYRHILAEKSHPTQLGAEEKVVYDPSSPQFSRFHLLT
jgi:hypothetical protein